jgi:ADP-ribose diphosphatase
MAGPLRWERRGERVLVSTRILSLLEVDFFHPARRVEREFVVVRSNDWVNVLALTADGRLVLVRQFRFGSDGFSLEIPGGIIEAGEDPVAAGVRELREETGYAGDSARLLASVHPNPAIMDNRCHFVLVEGASLRAPPEWDRDEEIEVVPMPADEALASARDGRITHSLVVAALMHFEPVWRARRKAAV